MPKGGLDALKVVVIGGEIKGSLSSPPSKSITHRALFCSALAQGESKIASPLISDDTNATCRVLRNIGIGVWKTPGCLRVEGGRFRRPVSDLFCGESGTTLRFSTAICALVKGDCRLTGGPSLSRRPLGPLIEGLRQVGVECDSSNGFPPANVMGRGEIVGGNVEIRGDVSSQFVSALLLVGPLSKNGVALTVTTKLESKPYVALTLDVQKEFGVEVEHDVEMKYFKIKKQKYRPTEKTVEGDWSSASYMLSAGALAGDVTIKNLSLESSQADKAIEDILKNMGARVSYSLGGGINVRKSELAGIEWSLSDTPDLFPIVAALCSKAEGESTLHGLKRLRYKESDRLLAMIEGLKKMGVKITKREDSVSIQGGSVEGATVNPYMDHRIAMAFGVLGMAAKGETIVTDAECVSKSYPNFWGEIENMGADIRRENDG